VERDGIKATKWDLGARSNHGDPNIAGNDNCIRHYRAVRLIPFEANAAEASAAFEMTIAPSDTVKAYSDNS
jgi:hypothetical protein